MVALGLESVLGTDNAASTGNGPALAKTKVREKTKKGRFSSVDRDGGSGSDLKRKRKKKT